MTVLAPMHMKLKGNTKRLLTLIFAISFLVNAQASYACDMMPDMAEQHIECCCGISHKSQLPSDHMDLDDSAPAHSGMNAMEQMCDDPHVGCCIVEISVGINDPPENDRAVTTGITKTQAHKHFKHIDLAATFVDVFASVESLRIPYYGLPAYLADPFLKNRPPALYKTTERYRI